MVGSINVSSYAFLVHQPLLLAFQMSANPATGCQELQLFLCFLNYCLILAPRCQRNVHSAGDNCCKTAVKPTPAMCPVIFIYLFYSHTKQEYLLQEDKQAGTLNAIKD